jgi:hypothetical protein
MNEQWMQYTSLYICILHFYFFFSLQDSRWWLWKLSWVNKRRIKKLRKKGKGKWYAWGKKREICKIEKIIISMEHKIMIFYKILFILVLQTPSHVVFLGLGCLWVHLATILSSCNYLCCCYEL